MNFMETRLFEDLRRSNFLKSWLIFYRFGLNDPLVRTLLMTGLEAWKPHPTFGNLQDWEFNEVFCFPPENELSIEEAACEMYEYYKFWVDCTLHGESFEVYDTIDGRGLGIRATKLVSLGTLSLEMVGFLETIEYSLYAWLSTRGYPSLYRFFDIITEKWVYGILFGPLALVNTAVGVTFGFSHLNLDGSDSCWRLTYRFGPVFEDLGDGVSTIYNRHQLLVEDTEEDEDGEFHAPIQMGENDSFQRSGFCFPLLFENTFFSSVNLKSACSCDKFLF